jgi:alanyl-tRNA synthetase
MVQFKSYFTGEATPPNPRLTSCQKCFRATDIDEVGDAGHLTFFEMLGNFSVGDYFKKESIEWAWEFVTEHLHLPQERLWITVFLDDDEAEGYWLDLDVPKERILRFGEKDNFWGPAGETGPCGPCSEIHYDFGEGAGCGKPDCDPSCDCDRFLEIWNLVFTEYDQDAQGNRTPLEQKNIDTGMGLERTAALVQGKSTLYETDLFTPIMDRLTKLTGHRYGESKDITRAMRVVAEHARAVTFLIADGVIPSNDGRGYVLRRVLRRAALFGRKLGLTDAFLTGIAEVVIDQMGGLYPELGKGRDYILNVVSIEESKFERTLYVGSAVLDETVIKLRGELKDYFPIFERKIKATLSLHDYLDVSSGIKNAVEHFRRDCNAWDHTLLIGDRNAIDESLEPVKTALEGLENIIDGNKLLSSESLSLDEIKQRIMSQFYNLQDIVYSVATKLTGFEVFILHDTYGFPKEITAEIAADNGLSIDLEGFETEMEAQRERAREAQKFGLSDKSDQTFYEELGIPPTRFVGYDEFSTETRVVGILVDGEPAETAFQGQEVQLMLAETPFYGEMGGQVGDTGEIKGEKGRVMVSDAQKPIESLVVHWGKVEEGVISIDDSVEAKVDRERRLDIARNHTATHLLHVALRQVLGEQVQQGGSLVAPDHFRFDFTHLIALSDAELKEVQHIVNENIRRNLPVSGRVMPYAQAIEEGALAFFGDKYGDEVRMVQISDPQSGERVSAELCGGTHLRSTGEIGFLHVTSEKSVGSGLRRIEAVTGRGAEALVEKRFSILESMAERLETGLNDADEKLSTVLAELSAERKRARDMEAQLLRKTAESLLADAVQVNGVNVLTAKVSASNMDVLRQTGDWLKDKLGSAVIVLGVVMDGNPRFLAMVTPDLLGKGIHAGKIVKQVAQVTGGGGGGKPEMAQAGGKDSSKIDEALKLVVGLVEKS